MEDWNVTQMENDLLKCQSEFIWKKALLCQGYLSANNSTTLLSLTEIAPIKRLRKRKLTPPKQIRASLCKTKRRSSSANSKTRFLLLVSLFFLLLLKDLFIPEGGWENEARIRISYWGVFCVWYLHYCTFCFHLPWPDLLEDVLGLLGVRRHNPNPSALATLLWKAKEVETFSSLPEKLQRYASLQRGPETNLETHEKSNSLRRMLVGAQDKDSRQGNDLSKYLLRCWHCTHSTVSIWWESQNKTKQNPKDFSMRLSLSSLLCPSSTQEQIFDEAMRWERLTGFLECSGVLFCVCEDIALTS